MPTKDQIINNLREYSALEIVQAIKSGEVTMYELSKSGKLTPLMRKRIEEQMATPSVNEIPMENNAHVTDDKTNEIPEVHQSPIVEKDETLQELHSPISPVATVISPVVTSPTSSINDEIIDNKGMFKRTFSFKGRIRRTEFGLSYIIYLVWYVIFISITEANDINPVIALFALLSMVPAFWFFWAQGAKRCHDRGNSGWYQIIPFYFLVMLFGGSEEGVNCYGTNPKEYK